ncbi:glycoside hydrolase family 3 protein [Viridothelium virens]|uniref:beta-glucosidase n=1 Tax=Viridothelium virens TaxID=1048519 RepID=A0A6A6H009_VIRVR|nr:glycoside hydrolase family 3 protein [Viridothelium virens]
MWRIAHAVISGLAVGAGSGILANAQSIPCNGIDNCTSPFPNTTYPAAVDPNAVPGAQSGQISPPFYPSPWMDGSGGWDAAYAKAQAFVRQLTLLEKVNLTTGVGWEGDRCVGNTGKIPRLNFTGLCLEDSPVGVRDTDFNTVFPAGVTIAATWDRELFYQRGYGMGDEHKHKGVDIQLGPVVGPLGRAPEAGRNWEGFSPDPVLSGIAVAQTVKGIQDAGVMACTKHYIAYEQEHFRQVTESSGYGYNFTGEYSANLDDKTMHELYLWPFADAVRAGTASIMCVYNNINGSYGCQNSHTLNYLLKGELGFQGFVMTDWGAHHSGVSSALAGLDMSMPGDTAFDSGQSFWGANLTIAVLNGSIPEWRIDDMATRVMAGYYLVGLDKNPIPVNFDAWTTDTYGYLHYIASESYGLINEHVDVRADHGQQARTQAAKGTVLLKNTNNALPLTGKEKLTAVFGDDAGDNPYGPNGCSDRGCDNGTLGMAWGSGTANFPYLITPLTAIQNEVFSNMGAIEDVTDNYAYDQISALARRADQVGGVSLVFVNADSGEGYIVVDTNEGDRNNLTLWRGGAELIANVSSQHNNTVVVMHTVGPVDISSFYDHPNITAIIWAGIPGEQSGNAIADVLYGRVNPGGKLPFTIGKNRPDYGTDVLYRLNNGTDQPQLNFQEGVFIDYRSFDKQGIDPIYEFGYGISYTNFSYSNLKIVGQRANNYVPNAGQTKAAPTLGNFSTDPAGYVFPAGFHEVPLYIYPYLNNSDIKSASNDSDYGEPANEYLPAGSQDGSPQPKIGAGGGPGGNPQLYDVFYTVTADITNTGKVAGDEVPQVYVGLGGPDDPKVVLRGFDRLTIAPGATATFSAELTRRDFSNWDPVSQNWVISNYTKTVYVGSSSRKLPLQQALGGSSNATAGGYGTHAPAHRMF